MAPYTHGQSQERQIALSNFHLTRKKYLPIHPDKTQEKRPSNFTQIAVIEFPILRGTGPAPDPLPLWYPFINSWSAGEKIDFMTCITSLPCACHLAGKPIQIAFRGR